MDEIVYYYKVYGLRIKSNIHVPELEVLDEVERDSVNVNLSYGIINEDIKEEIKNGKRANYENQNMWFYIKNVALYHIHNGNTVVIEPEENADFQMIKLYILGSVMGLILLQKNIVAIHGGGILIDGKGCVFTGDKGAGKSTITTALRKKGYKFVADDVCSIKNGEINEIHPGFPYQKLCEDSMTKLGYDIAEFEPFRGDLNVNKYIVPAFGEFVDEVIPFEAIFELKVGDVENVEIKEIIGGKKIKKLMENIFRIEMLHYSGGVNPIYFKKCLDIVQNIKFYKITRPKGIFSVEQQIELVEGIICKNEEDKLCELG